jgi:hypothetical protein
VRKLATGKPGTQNQAAGAGPGPRGPVDETARSIAATLRPGQLCFDRMGLEKLKRNNPQHNFQGNERFWTGNFSTALPYSTGELPKAVPWIANMRHTLPVLSTSETNVPLLVSPKDARPVSAILTAGLASEAIPERVVAGRIHPGPGFPPAPRRAPFSHIPSKPAFHV